MEKFNNNDLPYLRLHRGVSTYYWDIRTNKKVSSAKIQNPCFIKEQIHTL